MSTRTVRGGPTASTDHFGSGIIKTVILPNEEINRLALEAEELKQYLAVQKQVFEESIAAYDKDRLIRKEEFKMKEQDFDDQLNSLKARLDQRTSIN